MKLKSMLPIPVIFVILVCLAVIYAAIPAKTIFEITDWSANPHDYVRITIREMGMDNAVGVHMSYETENQELIKEILEYLNIYELKTWYQKNSYRLEPHEKSYDIYFDEKNLSYKKISIIGICIYI